MIDVKKELRERGFRIVRLDEATMILDGEHLAGPIVLSIRDSRADASQRLAFGLCREFGIDLPKGATPRDAWEALKELTGREPSFFYSEAGQRQKKRIQSGRRKGTPKTEVDGPKHTKGFIQAYENEHPEITKEAGKYRTVLRTVKNFPKSEDGTYSATTGEKLDHKDGFSVTFHQNYTEDDVFGAYDDDTYSAMCAISKAELESKDVYIGYYGNPEVSFNCKSLLTAFAFAVEHNQESIWDCEKGKSIRNSRYNPNTNPIRKQEE